MTIQGNVTTVEPNSPVTGQGLLTATAWSIPENLVYFQCVGYYSDIENPNLTGSSNIPLQNVITGVVTFYPRVPLGMVIYLQDLNLVPLNVDYTYQDTALAIAPIVARILSGQLQTIDVGDTPGISLLANTLPVSKALAAAGVPDGILIYDVQFSSIVYAEAAQVINNWSFVAPTSSVTISLTDPNLVRGPYGR